jgi:TM2 domain-containing membrane protein YozV
MKKLKVLFLFLGIVLVSNLSAAFPVEVKSAETSVVTNDNDKSSNVVANETKQSTTVAAPTMSSPASGKSQIVALLLVIFVGILGIHRFYLGYTTIGIIQLLTLGVFGIWSLIDLIMIVTGSLKPKDGDYETKL